MYTCEHVSLSASVCGYTHVHVRVREHMCVCACAHVCVSVHVSECALCVQDYAHVQEYHMHECAQVCSACVNVCAHV